MKKLKLVPSEDVLKEIFALFSSPSDDELRQAYDDANLHFYKREDLQQEYTLTQEKGEFAEDAWRAVIYFLYNRGFNLVKDGTEYDLRASSGYS